MSRNWSLGKKQVLLVVCLVVLLTVLSSVWRALDLDYGHFGLNASLASTISDSTIDALVERARTFEGSSQEALEGAQRVSEGAWERINAAGGHIEAAYVDGESPTSYINAKKTIATTAVSAISAVLENLQAAAEADPDRKKLRSAVNEVAEMEKAAQGRVQEIADLGNVLKFSVQLFSVNVVLAEQIATTPMHALPEMLFLAVKSFGNDPALAMFLATSNAAYLPAEMDANALLASSADFAEDLANIRGKMDEIYGYEAVLNGAMDTYEDENTSDEEKEAALVTAREALSGMEGIIAELDDFTPSSEMDTEYDGFLGDSVKREAQHYTDAGIVIVVRARVRLPVEETAEPESAE